MVFSFFNQHLLGNRLKIFYDNAARTAEAVPGRKENLMFTMTSVGAKISELRKKHNMTQMELADKMNISFQAVSNWERGVSLS